jgi:MoxR-like ATPase
MARSVTDADVRSPGIAATIESASDRVVGRERELELVVAAVAAGRDLVLEGPPGTSKTTILAAIASVWGIPLVFVEGNADLTPSRLVGHHNPVRVLQEDYSPSNFVDGPLVEAMRCGGFLYIEEFNRVPEDSLNTLITTMAERRLAVPRVGVIEARPSFRIIASMNPSDDVGTNRLSQSILDRLCRIAVAYQSADAERRITELRTAARRSWFPDGDTPLVTDAVGLTRATRRNREIRHGSSVRGAIDVALVADQLLAGRSVAPGDSTAYRAAVLDAMTVGLSGRIVVDETSVRTPEAVLRQIWEDYYAKGDPSDPG